MTGVLHEPLLSLLRRRQLFDHGLQGGAEPADLVPAGHGERHVQITVLADGFGHGGQRGQPPGDAAGEPPPGRRRQHQDRQTDQQGDDRQMPKDAGRFVEVPPDLDCASGAAERLGQHLVGGGPDSDLVDDAQAGR